MSLKKFTILLIGMLILMIALGCDGLNGGNGCNEPDDPVQQPENTPTDTRRGLVPTCGKAVVDSNGAYHFNRELAVNWNGEGAPAGPSNNPGFGEKGQPRPFNAYAWAMTSFGDYLYVGTMNRVNDRVHETGDISEGAEVWRYKPGATVNSGVWELELSAGFSRLSNYGVRAMAVYNDQLFAGTFNKAEGTELWRRTQDTAEGPGQWKVISKGGFGNPGNDSVRAMAVFNGQLYIGSKNNKDGASLFKYQADTEAVIKVDGATTDSAILNTEDVISELLPFGDYLWIFTWGSAGFSAYRMDSEENIELVTNISLNWQEWQLQDWQNWQDKIQTAINEDVSVNNSGIMSSVVFNGKIYLGTVNLNTGAEFFLLENPMAADPKDVKWTRLGENVFQVTENYLWRMQVYNGQLYIGTWNPYYSDAPMKSYNNIGATLYRMDKNEGFCQVMGHGRLIEEGFGKPENYGIRSMAEHKGRLYIGTAQPFKIEPGVSESDAAQREGTEVWEFDPSN